MPKLKKLPSAQIVSTGIRLLELLSAAPHQTVQRLDACHELGISDEQLSQAVDAVSSLSSRTSGARAAIVAEDGLIRLLGDAAQLMPLRLGPEEGAAIAHVLELLHLDNDTRKRIAEALLPLGTAIDAAATPLDTAGETPYYRGLLEAIEDGVRCRIRYRSLDDDVPTERLVDPIAMDAVVGEVYLLAWDISKDAQRRYRLDRLSDVEFTDHSVEPHDFQRIAVDESLAQTGTLTRLRARDAETLDRLNWAGIRRVDMAEDGSASFDMYVSSPRWLFDQVLAEGGALTIESPDALKFDLMAYTDQILSSIPG